MEERADRAQHLIALLDSKKPRLPQNCSYRVENSEFDYTINQELDRIEQRQGQLPPSFVMIDPFGVSGIPMSTIGRILEPAKSEVYVSVMYDYILRFKEHEYFQRHLDDLCGCRDWRDGLNLDDPQAWKAFFFDLYKRQLKKSGAKHVVHFELYEQNRLIYAIFFGTQSFEGSDKMKQAIWKAAPFGDYKFRGGLLGQLTLGDTLNGPEPLKTTLYDEFGDKGWVKIEKVTDFVKSDATEYHSGHLRRRTLMPMENDGRVEVKRPSGKTSGYPEGTLLRFVQGMSRNLNSEHGKDNCYSWVTPTPPRRAFHAKPARQCKPRHRPACCGLRQAV